MDRFPLQEELTMHKFFSDPGRDDGELAYLSAEDARHALTVLRMKPGQPLELIDGSGLWDAEIVSADSRDICVRKRSLLPSSEPSLSVTLFQGLPKSDKMDFIVQKATELGVSRIVPVLMNRCVSRPGPADMERKLQRWRKIIREAAKQSGRSALPSLAGLSSLEELSAAESLPRLNVVPWEEASGFGPLSFFRTHPDASSLGILIGPEGGIEEVEISLLKSAGFTPVTLGRRILRTETAGLAAVSSFMALYGEMDS